MHNGKPGRIAAGFLLKALIIAMGGFTINSAAIATAEQTAMSEMEGSQGKKQPVPRVPLLSFRVEFATSS